MKYRSCVLLMVLPGIAAVMCAIGVFRVPGLPGTAGAQGAEKEQDQKPKGPPPLVVDKGAPLLLEDPPQKDPWDIPIGPVADNTSCYCCHTNYEGEEFVVYHAKANVGCVGCHGQSYNHRDDEDNITPPDVMFPPEKIEPNCRECHETHDATAKDVITRWQERCPNKTSPEEILCMDCHGKHRLASRTVRWDKRTGKLLVRGQQPAVKKAGNPDKKRAPSEKQASQAGAKPGL